MNSSSASGVVKFGVDLVVLAGRPAAGQEAVWLAERGRKIQFDPVFVAETLRLLIAGFRRTIAAARRVHEALQVEDSLEKCEPFIRQLESSIVALNCAMDAATPWVIWQAVPNARVSRKEPGGHREILSALRSVEALFLKLMIGGDLDSGGNFWRGPARIARICREHVAELSQVLRNNPELAAALLSLPPDRQPTLRLERLEIHDRLFGTGGQSKHRSTKVAKPPVELPPSPPSFEPDSGEWILSRDLAAELDIDSRQLVDARKETSTINAEDVHGRWGKCRFGVFRRGCVGDQVAYFRPALSEWCRMKLARHSAQELLAGKNRDN